MENLIRNYVYRLVFWRVVGEVFALVRTAALGIENLSRSLERAAWQIEGEAARGYYAATGVHPGHAVGEPNRYLLGAPEELAEVDED